MEKVMSIYEMAIWTKKHLPNFGKSGDGGRGGLVRKKKSITGLLSRSQHCPEPVVHGARHKAVMNAERLRFKTIVNAGMSCGQIKMALALAANTNQTADEAVAILRGESGFSKALREGI